MIATTINTIPIIRLRVLSPKRFVYLAPRYPPIIAAGTSAAFKARRVDPNAKITILQEESVISYGACGIPYALEGLIPRFDMLIARSPEVFKKEHDIEIFVDTRAQKIDTNNNCVYADLLRLHEFILTLLSRFFRTFSLDLSTLCITFGC